MSSFSKFLTRKRELRLVASAIGGVVASDVRAWAMRQLKGSGVSATLRHLYPRMLAVHTLPDEVGFPDERGQLILPRLMRTSYSRMEPHGAYLVENGERAILWLGSAVSPQLLRDLYDVDSLDELDPRKVCHISGRFRPIRELTVSHLYPGRPAGPADPSLRPASQHPRLLRVEGRIRMHPRLARAAEHRRNRIRV